MTAAPFELQMERRGVGKHMIVSQRDNMLE
jgi:hypothetical protein